MNASVHPICRYAQKDVRNNVHKMYFKHLGFVCVCVCVRQVVCRHLSTLLKFLIMIIHPHYKTISAMFIKLMKKSANMQ